MKMIRYVVIAAGVVTITALTFTACTGAQGTRSARLLTMAAEEAGFIDNLQERLVRQLNIADLQAATDQNVEARKTLRLAAATLKVQEKATLDDFRRIAGWTSVAELSYRAGDVPFATDAYYNAVEALNSVQPEPRRAEYVLSLSEICAQLKGKVEAGRLLVKGGNWAMGITNPGVRQYALRTFSARLIRYDDFDAARSVLRLDPDPRWRSDTLASLAREQAAEMKNYEVALTAPEAAPKAVSRDAVVNFNKSVRYSENFRQQTLQNDLAPR